MKKLITLLTIAFVWSSVAGQGYQTIEEDKSIVYAPKNNGVLTVHNVNGPVVIKGTNRTDVLVQYKLKVKPKSSRGLAQAKKDLSFDIMKMGDSVAIVLNSPFVNYYKGQRHINIDSESMDYWFVCDIEVEVPSNINLNVATVNDGIIKIENITGSTVADNVNGDVTIDKVNGQVVAETINGDIRVNFLSNPGDGSNFQTINGNIKTNVPQNLSASISFKSMNGEFYTDFDYSVGQTGGVLKDESDRHGTEYRIEQLTKVKIGSGKAALSYETLNGNMYLRKLN